MIAPAPAHALGVRRHAALLDGERVDLAAGPLSGLRALAPARGPSYPATCCCGLPGGDADAHAVETTVSRLRGGPG